MSPPIGVRLQRRIKRLLRKLNLKYIMDEDGDFQLILSGEQIPVQLRILILRDGLMQEVLAFVVRFEGKIPVYSETEAIYIANQWNALRRWPRIFWRNGHFYGDFHIDAESDIPQAFLELNFKHFLSASLQFALQVTGQEEELLKNFLQQLLGGSRLN
ncbi:MAG: YbjN domain-containing protein [Bacteroidia bacterium]|nr:YbjN domain-containing protein [Bacteroidia bacterium]MCX7764552.1 YbjN domain-containing protein [Bacteroidia bacterium]MDW8058291.1 YbjN domain-containing protein [Bacteroidia bacterium]